MRIRGQLFLLKISDGNSPETFTTIAGQRSGSKQITAEPIETTSKDESRWKKLLTTGLVGATINARGLISDADSYKRICNIAAQGTVHRYQVIFSTGLTITGPFQIEKWGGEGDYKESQQYEITLVGAHDIEIPSEIVLTSYLLINEGTDYLLLSESGGDRMRLIEEGFPEIGDLSGRGLDDAIDIDALLAFTYEADGTNDPFATDLPTLAESMGARPRTVGRYTAPGVYQWDKPVGATFVTVVVVGGGGGGGAGPTSTSSGAGAGGGGGGGCLVSRQYAAADVPSQVTVTVGAGGNGGAAITNSGNSSGNHGLTGASSSFGALLTGYAGGGGCAGFIGGGASGGGGGGGKDGIGGSTTVAAGGLAGTFGGSVGGTGGSGAGGSTTLWVGAAGGGSGSSNTNGGNGGRAQNGGGGGGAGGGTGSALRTGGFGGGFGGDNAGGAVVAADGATQYPTFAASLRGWGGGGGANSISVASGAGGDGGRGQAPGGGGGGGGGAFGSGTKVSGAGGSGGDGCVIVYVDY